MIQLHDLKFEPFISEEKITSAIEVLSEKVNKEYRGKNPVFLGILNGAFLVASEIIKKFEGNCEVAFVKLGSYKGTSTTGAVETLLGLDTNLMNRHILVIEDIVDTGHTLIAIDKIIKEQDVADYKILSLFFKPKAYKGNLPINFVGIEIPNDFIVGYGLDYNGLGRNLTQVYKLKKLQ